MSKEKDLSHPHLGVLAIIGGTPLVEIARIQGTRIHVKLEKSNPTQSMKDRMALSIVTGAEARGELPPGGIIIESSSGNSATALAMIAAAKGYRFVAVVDRHASREKLAAIRSYGATVVVASISTTPQQNTGASERLEEVARLRERWPEAFFADQANNRDNPLGYQSLADELLATLDSVDVLIGGVGSGGSLCGTARALRQHGSAPRIVAVEPLGSVTFGGPEAPFYLFGMGNPGNVPTPRNVDVSVINAHYRVSDRDAFNTARALARSKGLLLGPSSGATIHIALALATTTPDLGQMVVIAADGGEKYLSTVYSDDWMHEQGLDDEQAFKRVSDLLAGTQHTSVVRH